MLRVATTSLRTGELLCDYVPIRVEDVSFNLMDHGDFTGLIKISRTSFENYRDALLPARTMLWVLDDHTPLWAGIIWEWEHAGAEEWLKISASTLGSLLNRRVLSDSMSFISAHPYDIFTTIVNYALAKTGGNVARLSSPLFSEDGFAATPMSRVYAQGDYANIWETLTGLAGDGGFEFDFQVDRSDLALSIRLAEEISEVITVPTLTYPGNVVAYDYPWSTTGVANYVRVLGSTTGGSTLVSDYPHGVDELSISEGWPLLETVVNSGTANGVALVDLNTRADNELAVMKSSRVVPEVTVTTGPGGLKPSDVRVGDRVNLALQSSLYGIIEEARRIMTLSYVISDNYVSALKIGLG